MVNCASSDVLGTLPVEDVWKWYHRLADSVGKVPIGGREPLASRFLRWYVSPRSRTGPETFDAPSYLRDHAILRSALLHHRNVYLSQEEMRTGGGGRRLAGIRPRWQRPADYGWTPPSPLPMYYRALVEVPLRWQTTGSDAEKDILHGLGLGFQLRTDVVCRVSLRGSTLDVAFESFQARIEDRFDFNYDEHLTVPNPDLGAAGASAICPSKRYIKVHHTNARRMEQARLAAPYDLVSETWRITATDFVGPASIPL